MIENRCEQFPELVLYIYIGGHALAKLIFNYAEEKLLLVADDVRRRNLTEVFRWLRIRCDLWIFDEVE